MTINTMDPSIAVGTDRHVYLPNDTFALFKMLQIEWKSSNYHSDGRRRSRPKASTVHGWLVKWRATFSGNERLRKEGMREMREAKEVREWKRKRKAARQAKAGVSRSFFRLWPISLGKSSKKRRPQTPKALARISPHTPAKRPSHNGPQRLPSQARSPRPTPSSSRRSSHNHHGTPQNRRKASQDSRRSAVRTTDRRRQ